jgi:hypothetical protein
MAQTVSEREVTGPAGGKFTVMTDGEETLFDDLVKKYTTHNQFVNISDQQDLERIIYLETLSLRYANWLSTETDYTGELIDTRQVSTMMKDFSGELRQLKKSVGIDKPSRQREASESVSDYIEQLKIRAKEFGIAREEELTTALTLFNELIARMTLMDNCTEEERVEQHARPEDLFKWLREEAIPEFTAIDEYFIENSQRFWVREQ